jgi:hypothetical protein
VILWLLGVLGIWLHFWHEIRLLDFVGFKWLFCLRGLLGIWIIQVFKFIGFVSVIKAIRDIVTLNEYAKKREAPSECQGRWGVCNSSAHFAGKDCTYVSRP